MNYRLYTVPRTEGDSIGKNKHRSRTFETINCASFSRLHRFVAACSFHQSQVFVVGGGSSFFLAKKPKKDMSRLCRRLPKISRTITDFRSLTVLRFCIQTVISFAPLRQPPFPVASAERQKRSSPIASMLRQFVRLPTASACRLQRSPAKEVRVQCSN